MIYKFDILFKKSLRSGGLKVVTYRSLLENPEIFGVDEGFVDAEGELSMVLEGPEEGFSINALLRKYRAQLVGRMNAEMFAKDIPLRFVFSKADDLSSIRIELRDEDGYTYSSDVHTQYIVGSKILDLSYTDSFVVLIAKEGDFSILNGDLITNIKTGQVCFCSASTEQLTINSNSAIVIIVSTTL